MKIYKYTYMISFGGHGCFKCTELECRECEKNDKNKGWNIYGNHYAKE